MSVDDLPGPWHPYPDPTQPAPPAWRKLPDHTTPEGWPHPATYPPSLVRLADQAQDVARGKLPKEKVQ